MGDEIPVKTEEKQNKPQLFKPGQSGNPDGRPKGSKNDLTLLKEALKDVEKTKDNKLFKRFIERAFINDKVLIAAMKKFVSDKQHTELAGAEGQPVVINLIPVKTKKDIEKLEDD